MNRLSWDTTAPRRPTGKRASANPRTESAVEAEADIIRVAWDKPQRINPFYVLPQDALPEGPPQRAFGLSAGE